jgi:hypothetical protein
MKTLAILQNQWFKNPERAQAIYDSHGDDLDRRAQLNRAYLFMGCATGRRIKSAFGDAACAPGAIIWEEANPKKAGESSGCFPPDPDHIRRILDYHAPDVVIAFGNVAREVLEMIDGITFYGTRNLGKRSWTVLFAPHPAARGADTMDRLRQTANRWREIVSLYSR